jgi:predicted heme/steroid binding protein
MAQEREGAAEAALMMSTSKLASYNGVSQGALVYVALAGEVYDVTSAAGMYGPGGPYNGGFSLSFQQYQNHELDKK